MIQSFLFLPVFHYEFSIRQILFNGHIPNKMSMILYTCTCICKLFTVYIHWNIFFLILNNFPIFLKIQSCMGFFNSISRTSRNLVTFSSHITVWAISWTLSFPFYKFWTIGWWFRNQELMTVDISETSQ